MATLTVQFDGTGRLELPGKLPVILKVGDMIEYNGKTSKIEMLKSNQIVCQVDGRFIALTPEELAMVVKVRGGKSRKTRKSRKNKSRRYRRV